MNVVDQLCRNPARFMLSLPLGFSLLFLVSSYALAEADPGPSVDDIASMSLEEILELDVDVSVASFSEEDQLVVGSTVEEIKRSNWRARGARTVADALGGLPGSMVAPTAFGGYVFAIRGFTSVESSRGISTQLDGFPINQFKYGTALYTLHSLQVGVLDEIEMIRGPGSTLYGGDAFHGVVSLQTFESDVDVVEVDADTGSDLYRHTALRASQALTDTLRANVAISYNGQPDQDERYEYTDSSSMLTTASERENQFDALMAVVKLEAEPSESVTSSVGLYVKGQEQHRFQGLGRLGGVSADDFGQTDNRFVMGAVTTEVKLPQDLSVELKGFGWRDTIEGSLDRPANPAGTLFYDTTEHRTGAKLFLKQPTNSLNTQWATGIEYNYMEVSEDLEQGLPTFTEGYDRSVSSFVTQARTDFFESALQVLYGFRFDRYSDAENHTSPRAGLIYHPTEDSAIKLLYGNAFRPNTAQEATGSSAVLPATGTPEVIDTYELAFLQNGEGWRSSLTLFHTDWEDALRVGLNSDPNGPPFVRTNIGKNQSDGIEGSVVLFNGPWRANLSGSYIESKDETNNADYVAFPRWIINAGAGVKFEKTGLEFFIHNRLHLDAAEAPISGFVPQPKNLADYWRTDLTVVWHATKNWDIHADLLNVFDRNNFYPSAVGSEGGIPDIGITGLIGLRYRT